MKKSLSLFLAFVILVSSSLAFSSSAYAAAKFYGAKEYITVSKAEDLKKIKENPQAVIYFTKDIDCTGYTPDKNPLGSFKGTVEGNGHTIKNYKGRSIFAYTNRGTLRNLVFENCIIGSGWGIAAFENLGVIENIVINNCNRELVIHNGQDNYLGDASIPELTFDNGIIRYCVSNNCKRPMVHCNYGAMIGCINNSDLAGSSDPSSEFFAYYLGGITSIASDGMLVDCVNNGNIAGAKGVVGGIYGGGVAQLIRCTNNGKIETSGDIACGIGCSYYTTVNDCVNNGDVTGETAYGIAVNGKFKTCVNKGKITATKDEAIPYAIANKDEIDPNEENDYLTFIMDSYYLEGTGEGSGNAVSLTAEEFSDSASYSNFDFDKIWRIKDEAPYLKVNDAKTIGIAVKTLPKKTTGYMYFSDLYEGDYLDTTGMKLVAFDSHGNQFTPEYYHINHYDIMESGTYRIHVYYDNFSTYFNVKTYVKPATVKGIKASKATKNSLTLTWKKSSAATGYEVQKYNEKYWDGWQTVKSVKKNTITVKKLKKGKAYKFRIISYRIVKGKKLYGDYSKTFTAKTKK